MHDEDRQLRERRIHEFLAAIVLAAFVVLTASAGEPNPERCSRCYETLQKDNRDCESLQGQDWKICREAAAAAYRNCSKGC